MANVNRKRVNHAKIIPLSFPQHKNFYKKNIRNTLQIMHKNNLCKGYIIKKILGSPRWMLSEPNGPRTRTGRKN